MNLVNLFNNEPTVGAKAELMKMHDDKYNAISPAFPKGYNAKQEIDFIFKMNACLSSKTVKAQHTIDNIYYESMPLGATVSWTLSGIHSSKCPAPYDSFKPTNRQVKVL